MAAPTIRAIGVLICPGEGVAVNVSVDGTTQASAKIERLCEDISVLAIFGDMVVAGILTSCMRNYLCSNGNKDKDAHSFSK